MKELKISATYETRISSKDKEYNVLVITFENGYKKTVFLDHAEQFMINGLAK